MSEKETMFGLFYTTADGHPLRMFDPIHEVRPFLHNDEIETFTGLYPTAHAAVEARVQFTLVMMQIILDESARESYLKWTKKYGPKVPIVDIIQPEAWVTAGSALHERIKNLIRVVPIQAHSIMEVY